MAVLTDDQVADLLKPHANVDDLGPHPPGYCSVPFRAIRAEHRALVTAWVERDGLGHRSFHLARMPDHPHSGFPPFSEPFWIIPRARLALD